MAPKRKAPAPASAKPAAPKAAKKGLAKGDQFPKLPALTSDEETSVDLNVRESEGERKGPHSMNALFVLIVDRGGAGAEENIGLRTRRKGIDPLPPPPYPPPCLQSVLESSGLLLFSYPRANTGGCTAQAKGFNEHYAALEKAGFKVFGISADRPKSQANWRAKHGFK